MGKIIVADPEGLLGTIDLGGAGKVSAYPVSVLIL